MNTRQAPLSPACYGLAWPVRPCRSHSLEADGLLTHPCMPGGCDVAQQARSRPHALYLSMIFLSIFLSAMGTPPAHVQGGTWP